MRKRTRVYKICAVFTLLAVIGCGDDTIVPVDCGDPATLTNTPAQPVLGGFPSQTDQTEITLFGRKSINAGIVINGTTATDFDCSETWSADITLDPGANSLEISALNRTGGAGPSTTIGITQGTFPLPPITKFGGALCDVDGDGSDDLIVGSYENDSGGGKKNVGRVFIYHGAPGGPGPAPDVVLTGENAEDHFGISVSCAGDVNGDAFSDVIVGAYLNDAGGRNAGRAYIYYGGSPMNDVADVVMTGEAANDQFGVSVSGLGDVNGDGSGDVIVGAYLNDAGGTDAGRAYIYYGGAGMDDLPDAVITGDNAGDQLGIRVARGRYINADNYDDIILSASRAAVGGLINTGKAYIFYGSKFLAGRNARRADVILEGATGSEAFASVNGAGDLDKDGKDDVVVGASTYRAGPTTEVCDDFVDNDADKLIDRQDPDCYQGRAYVFIGSTLSGLSIPATVSATGADFILDRPPGADGFGFSVASAGDVDGDGFSDLLVGAFLSDRMTLSNPNENCTDGIDNDMDTLTDFEDPDCLIIDQGRAYLYFGKTPFHTSPAGRTPDITLIGEARAGTSLTPESGQFGFALSGAGKVDGDAIDDLVIGAYLWDSGSLPFETDIGRVYAFFGRSRASWISTSTIDLNVPGSASVTLSGSDSETDSLGPDNGFGISVQ